MAVLSETNCWEVKLYGQKYKRLKSGEWVRLSKELRVWFSVDDSARVLELNRLVEEAKGAQNTG